MQNENSSLATNLSAYRKNLGLSQEALAEKANVSLSTIQRIEKGTVTPRAFTIKILAETLNVDITSLMSSTTQSETSNSNISPLKKLNLVTLFFVFLPFINLIVPTIFWRMNEELENKNSTAGKILSFQLLWSFIVVIGMGITLFLGNLIIGAGDSLFFIMIYYLLAVLFNIFTIAKTAFKLNNKDENILSFIPNLF
ncbi:helix-turn-helix transcriptional regulator [Tenacibaculum aiptasiae]|uniref:Helix-turn-helix transcriptional regulator n=1 Tax=Tenacibaculum aiptasiae TaxID=426481 RepID=A0A7J5APK9_9FLAO|nr:helix-turn-helix transcriptional regulator [Tenacibaculum aiptasiae]KAB1159394.1 helix-turn-helix transcriptional regulator [Tenacibaculum aiptasiae]